MNLSEAKSTDRGSKDRVKNRRERTKILKSKRKVRGGSQKTGTWERNWDAQLLHNWMEYVQSGTTMGHWEKHTKNDKDRGSIRLHPSLKKKNYYIYVFVWCMCVHARTCKCARGVLVEDNLRESVLSFQQAYPGGQIPGHQAGQPMPLFTEPSVCPLISPLYMSMIMITL